VYQIGGDLMIEIQDKRLLLRVLVKLMLLVSLLFLVYALFAGFIRQDGGVEILEVDVGGLESGKAGYFLVGNRRLIVVRKPRAAPGSAAYLVARAEDPVFGCDLRLQEQTAR
jgi:hypothetical protein